MQCWQERAEPTQQSHSNAVLQASGLRYKEEPRLFALALAGVSKLHLLHAAVMNVSLPVSEVLSALSRRVVSLAHCNVFLSLLGLLLL